MDQVEFIVESPDRGWVEALHSESGALTVHGFEVDAPSRSPGFGQSLVEICAAIGLTSLPLGIAGNLVASWIWEAIAKRGELPAATITVSTAGRAVRIDLTGQSAETVREAIEAALAGAVED